MKFMLNENKCNVQNPDNMNVKFFLDKISSKISLSHNSLLPLVGFLYDAFYS